MDEETREAIGRKIREALAKSRGYASYFDWPDRDAKEVGICISFFESLEAVGQPAFSELRARGQGNDPPDCEAVDLDGRLIGFEVTELVDEEAIKHYRRGQTYDWASWDKQKLVAQVRARLDAKDIPAKVRGGPYARYVLLIHCDEPELSFDHVNTLLGGVTFGSTKLIDDAYLLFSYDPRYERCPFLRLAIA
jgi:hypothetical protein